MGRQVRAFLREFCGLAICGYLMLLLLSIPVWYALTLVPPYGLWAQVWYYTLNTTAFHNATLPHTHLATASLLWFNANIELMPDTQAVAHLAVFRIWQLWLYWAGHGAGVAIRVWIALMVIRLSSYVWVPLIPAKFWDWAGVDPDDEKELRSLMPSLLNLITGDDLRDLSLYQTMWQRGSRQMGIGLGMLAIPILLAPFIMASPHPTWRSWVLPGGLAVIAFMVIAGGQALHAKAEALKRSDDMAELDHLRTLHLTDATKNTRGPRDYEFETHAQIRALAHELALAEVKETHAANQRQHLRWSQIVRQTEGLMKTIVLAQVELRNNPASEEILRQLKDLYDTTQAFNPDVEADPELITALYERIMLARLAKQYGVNVNGA